MLPRIADAIDPLRGQGPVTREINIAARLDDVSAALTTFTDRVERMTTRVNHVDGSQLRELRDAISLLQWSTRRQLSFHRSVLRDAQHAREREATRQRVFDRLTRIAGRNGAVVVGPWTGEVGYELLYWTPFVRWAVETFGIHPNRLILVSRGGTETWYGIKGARYRDVLEFCSPDEFFRQTAKNRKQRALRRLDRHVIRGLRHTIRGRMSVLHPSLMYALYMSYWKERLPVRWVEQFARHARIEPPQIAELDLPADYVAVRFYFSKNFPETPQNHAFLNSLVESLTEDTDVVLLGSGFALDDHRDFRAGRSDRVHTVEHLIEPHTNLAVQTAVIGRARAFIGTYGGFSYLAPLCGVNTVAVYTLRKVYAAFAYHLDFAQQAFMAANGGSLTLVDASKQPFMRHLAAAASSPH